jgi:predicted metal-dependent phosphoesterase TrpH
LNFVDLHCHTTASDGKHAPREVVRMAAERALQVIAIADHDTTDGLAEALAAGVEAAVEVIPAVELSCEVESGELHMLGYYPDYESPAFQAELQRLRQGRHGRAEAMARKLTGMGYPVAFDRIQALAAGGAIGRPHVAQALVEAGHVQNSREAFDRFIGRDGPAYVPRAKLTPAEACRLIRNVGGVPVFAHPFIVVEDRQVLEPLPVAESLPELVEAGLMGLEVYYPGYSTDLIGQLLALARQHHLIVTGGSDFHGEGLAGAPLGSVYVPRKCVRQLKDAYEHQRS